MLNMCACTCKVEAWREFGLVVVWRRGNKARGRICCREDRSSFWPIGNESSLFFFFGVALILTVF